MNVQRLTAPRIIDQFGRKRCQNKRKDVGYKFLLNLFQWYFVVYKLWAVKNSVSTYVCYAPDSLFWTVLYVLNKFLTADRSFTTIYFWKNLIEVGSSYLYASFGTVCVQIGQLFEAKWDFHKLFGGIRNRLHFPSKTAILSFSNFFQRLTVPQIIDHAV